MRWWLGSDGLGRGIARDGRMRLGESRVFGVGKYGGLFGANVKLV